MHTHTHHHQDGARRTRSTATLNKKRSTKRNQINIKMINRSRMCRLFAMLPAFFFSSFIFADLLSTTNCVCVRMATDCEVRSVSVAANGNFYFILSQVNDISPSRLISHLFFFFSLSFLLFRFFCFVLFS